MSDAQYRTFRDNLPYVALLLPLHPLLRRLYQQLRPVISTSKASSGKANDSTQHVPVVDGDARLEQRASFDFGFALFFLTALHGVSALKIMLILYLNYSIATRLPKQYVPAMTWIFNISTLFANELCQGYKFAKIEEFLMSLLGSTTASHDVGIYSWGDWLDGYGGIMPRWDVLFNITVLRLISFNMDYYWSLDRRAGSPVEVCLHIMIVKFPESC